MAKVLHQDGRNCSNANIDTGLLKRIKALCVKDCTERGQPTYVDLAGVEQSVSYLNCSLRPSIDKADLVYIPREEIHFHHGDNVDIVPVAWNQFRWVWLSYVLYYLLSLIANRGLSLIANKGGANQSRDRNLDQNQNRDHNLDPKHYRERNIDKQPMRPESRCKHRTRKAHDSLCSRFSSSPSSIRASHK